MNAIEQALKIAIMAHEGQKDLDGLPAVLHPLTVGFAGQTEDEMVVGILHDTIEDSETIVTFLAACGFPQRIIDAIELLTHTKDMTYDEYLHRILQSGNELALNVKLNDLRHNIKRGIAGGHQKQVEKHQRALRILMEGE